jgi:hypothetical protein
MIDSHLEVLNQTIRDGIEAGHNAPNPEPTVDNQNVAHSAPAQEAIVRARSMNDLNANTTPTFITDPNSRIGLYVDDIVPQCPASH